MPPITPNDIRRDQDIDGFRVRLYFMSRDRSVLLALSLCLLALAVSVAWFLRAPDLWKRHSVAADESLRSELQSPKPDGAKILGILAAALEHPPQKVKDELRALFLAAKVEPAARELIEAYWDSLSHFGSEPNARLLWLAYRPAPLPKANELIGDLHLSADKRPAAATYYQREIDLVGTESSRAKLIQLLVYDKKFAHLGQLSGQPAFAAYFTPHLRLRLAVHARDWREVARALTNVELETFKLLPLTLVCVAALGWFAIAVQAIQPKNLFCWRTFLPVLALLVGVASAWPSRFLAVWQEELWDLHAGGDFINNFAFYLGSVAPREALLKLLLILPFMPALLKRDSRLETLVVSGCIGLGFAMEGNLQSYQHAGPDGSFGRFLTANFFHFAITGLAGLALGDFVRAPRHKGFTLLVAFLATILAQGIYDGFMSVPGVRVLSLFSTLSFLVVALVFFHELRPLRDETTDQLYLSATLVLVMSILSGTMLVCASMQLGFPLATASLGANALGLSLIIVVFYRQLGGRILIPTTETPAYQL